MYIASSSRPAVGEKESSIWVTTTTTLRLDKARSGDIARTRYLRFVNDDYISIYERVGIDTLVDLASASNKDIGVMSWSIVD